MKPEQQIERNCVIAKQSMMAFQQGNQSTCDLVLMCRGGVGVHVTSAKLIQASHSEVFREIVEKAMTERTSGPDKHVLGVPDDDPEAWRYCWALIDNGEKPALNPGKFIATIKLAHKYQLDGVLFKCQDRLVCSFLEARQLMRNHRENYIHYMMDPYLCNGSDVVRYLEFLCLLCDVGLTTAYKVAFGYLLACRWKQLLEYLKQRMATHDTLSDCLQVSKDLTVWLLDGAGPKQEL